MKKVEPGTYHHYKGGVYYVTGRLGTHSETREDLAEYYTDGGWRWYRPVAMFHETVKAVFVVTGYATTQAARAVVDSGTGIKTSLHWGRSRSGWAWSPSWTMTPRGCSMRVIDIQAKMRRVGVIRLGDQKPANGPGKRLSTFRLTSNDKHALEVVGQKFGGQVMPWPNGSQQWQIVTKANELPIELGNIPATTAYEYWAQVDSRGDPSSIMLGPWIICRNHTMPRPPTLPNTRRLYCDHRPGCAAAFVDES